MMPYPASGDDADRAAKLKEEMVLGAIASGKGRTASDARPEDPSVKRPGAAADDDDDLPPVWKRYIDSRLKQFGTR
jgi:hypothetical protein